MRTASRDHRISVMAPYSAHCSITKDLVSGSILCYFELAQKLEETFFHGGNMMQSYPISTSHAVVPSYLIKANCTPKCCFGNPVIW